MHPRRFLLRCKVVLELPTKSSSCFTNVQLFAIGASLAVDDIRGGTREVISDQ